MKSRKQDTRSEDGLKDANRKLRSENQKLKKKVSQLQKALSKLQSSQFLQDWDEEEPILPSKKEPPLKESVDQCPKCKDELNIIPAGIFVIRKCDGCGFKSTKKIKKD